MRRYAMWKWVNIGLIILWLGLTRCSPTSPALDELSENIDSVITVIPKQEALLPRYVIVSRNISMREYFSFIDSLANACLDNSSLPNEYVLVNANPWIIDSLRILDYYYQKARGKLVYDQTLQLIFHQGDSLLIPDSLAAISIIRKLISNRIDVNLPEYRLRIIQGLDTVFTCKVRIGQNKNKYLEYYHKEIDLRTPIGEGEIVSVRKHPIYFDLETGEEYVETKRDDGRRTRMPIMPSLTPSINGIVTGALIHATTNPKSLGKAYSNGCIGTSEPDIWSIYYAAPPGTKVTFRYDLEVRDKNGNHNKLRDIYYRKE